MSGGLNMEKQQKIAAAITRAATNVIFVKAFSQLIHHGEQRRHTRHTHAHPISEAQCGKYLKMLVRIHGDGSLTEREYSTRVNIRD